MVLDSKLKLLSLQSFPRVVHVEFKFEVLQAGGMLGFLQAVPHNEALVVKVGSQCSH